MKLILISLVATLLTVNVFAKPMEAAKLEKINAYVAQEVSADDEDISAKFSKVNVDEKTDLVDSLTFEVTGTGEETFEIIGSATMTGKVVQLSVMASADGSEIGMSLEDMFEMMPTAQEYVSQFNQKQSDYKAKLSASMDENEASIKLSVSPVSVNAISIKTFVIEITASADLKDVMLSVDGTFNSEADLVTEGQKALTAIMNALAAGTEPTDEDMEGLEKVIEEIMKGLDMD